MIEDDKPQTFVISAHTLGLISIKTKTLNLESLKLFVELIAFDRIDKISKTFWPSAFITVKARRVFIIKQLIGKSFSPKFVFLLRAKYIC